MMVQKHLFQKAVDAHIRGDLEEALGLYGRALQRNPDDWAALNNMGIILISRGENERALELIRKALHLNPGYPDGLNTLATALKKNGDLHGAVEALEKALAVKPDFMDARFNLGNLYRDMGEYEKALEAFQEVLAIHPRDPDALNALGSLFSSMGRHEEGKRSCLRSLDLNPHQAAAHYTLGMISMREGDRAGAARSFRSALRIEPASSDACLSLGTLMTMEGRLDDAVKCFQRAVSINPRSADGFYNLGLAQERLGDLDAEIATQEAALGHCPDAPQSWIGAVRAFSKIAAWSRVDPLMERIVRHPFAESEESLLSSALFMLHSFPMADEDVFEKHLLWGEHAFRSAFRLFGNAAFDFTALRNETGRIRVGYVSPDFCRHSVGWFFSEISRRHDSEGFEIHCYATGRGEDDLTAGIKGSVASFSNVDTLNTGQFAGRIYRDQIHILVDLAGHTRGNRLDVFALRPAPIQVTMMGYPNGTGLRTMDYRITDRHAETPSSVSCCLERHVYLPKGFLPFYPVRTAADPIGRERLGLPRGKTILISLNRAGKLRPEVLRLWDRVLTRCQEAVLALGCGDVHREDLRGNVLSHFAADNRPKLFFIPRARTEEIHRARYLLADLALDPFPYAGTTTSYEALAMGVPVITLAGGRHVQRTTSGLLSQLDIPDTIAGSETEYVEKAVSLIADSAFRRKVRDELRNSYRRMSERQPREFVQGLERAYRLMWQRCQEGKEPREMIDCT